MKKLISVLLLAAMLLSSLASCGFSIPQKADADLSAYPVGEATAQNTAYTSQTAWNGTTTDTSWYSSSATSFTLNDGADLKGFINLVFVQGVTFENKTVKLGKDINLGKKAWSIPTSEYYFKGTFDGNYKTIGGFTITTDQSNQSLLGAIGGGATVKNLTVLDGTVTMQNTATQNSVGGVISRVVCESGKTVTVSGVTSGVTLKQKSDTSTANYVGGVIGLIEGSGTAVKITNCTFTGSISTQNMREVGGIVGSTKASAPLTFAGCTNKATLVRGREYIGGILGSATKADANLTFNSCINEGTVELYHEYAGGNAGGIVGRVVGKSGRTISFTGCENKGTVGALGHANFKNQTEIDGGRWVGGIAGYVYGDGKEQLALVSFSNCHSTGKVKANRTSGGLVGYVQRTKKLTLTNCSVNADLQFIINDHAFNSATDMANRYVGGLLGAVETEAATYNGGAAVVLSGCSVGGTMHVFEPYHFNSKAGGLVGMVRKSYIQMTSCRMNLKITEEHLERNADVADLDEVNLILAGFQNNGGYFNGESAQDVTYFYHNDVPVIESYATPNNTAAFFKPVGHQFRYNEKTNTYDLRYVFGVSNLLPTDLALGFDLDVKLLGDSVTNRKMQAYCDTIYSTINADGTTYAASDFDCDYLCTLTIQGIPAKDVVTAGEAAYAKNAIMGITPFTAYEDANKEIVLTPAAIGAVQHTYEPERHTFGQEAFTPYLPDAFKDAETVIEQYNISYKNGTGVDCVNYKQLGTKDQYSLQSDCTCGESCGWSANAATAYKLNPNVPYHYYIDVNSYNSKFGTTLADRYEAYYSFEFEVAEDGYYDFCFRIRLNAGDGGRQIRYALVQFDDEAYHEQNEFYYDIVVRHGIMLDNDDNRDSYITGYSKYLTKGKHTVTFRQPYDALDGTKKDSAFHIREIYYFKDAAEPVDAKIPLPAGAVLYDGNFANNVTYALDQTTKSVFTSYVNTLKANGFTQADYRETKFQYSDFDVTNKPSDGNYTYTGNYVGDQDYYNYYYILTNADYMLNVYFCTATGDMRIVVSDVEEYERYAEINEAAEAPYTAITTPLFAQLDIGGRDFVIQTGDNKGSNITGVTNGLCYVYRLSDGRFMVIDGGYWNDKDTEGEEMARLFKWMQEHADYDGDGIYTNNKVTIAAWLITHHHSDHINGAYKFGMMYKDNELVEIQNFMYNFPSFEYAESNYGTDLQIGNAYTKFYPKMYTMLGHYDSLIAHSGMVYEFADAKIEILSTHEDFYPHKLNIYNNSSTIFKITLAGKTFLVAGDLQEEGQIKAIKRCGTLLESDFLQVTHHGCNGQVEFFKYIVGKDASGNFNTDTVIVWPLPKGENQAWYEGTSARAVAMRWLRDHFNTSTNDTTHFAIENWVFTDFK